ncbi:hypothetical protein Syun_029805 [Stephania yunnanensis]|uniref:Uncharacterized protein n=1 Tax=Stephania yunnanensis TaxID=152371 RepID=A0AAP0E6A8_9MAGN
MCTHNATRLLSRPSQMRSIGRLLGQRSYPTQDPDVAEGDLRDREDIPRWICLMSKDLCDVGYVIKKDIEEEHVQIETVNESLPGRTGVAFVV